MLEGVGNCFDFQCSTCSCLRRLWLDEAHVPKGEWRVCSLGDGTGRASPLWASGGGLWSSGPGGPSCPVMLLGGHC